jgi:hypothetical protein
MPWNKKIMGTVLVLPKSEHGIRGGIFVLFSFFSANGPIWVSKNKCTCVASS